jgi:hypothetical protein
LNTASSKIGWLAGFQVQALNTHKVKLPINKNNYRGGNEMRAIKQPSTHQRLVVEIINEVQDRDIQEEMLIINKQYSQVLAGLRIAVNYLKEIDDTCGTEHNEMISEIISTIKQVKASEIGLLEMSSDYSNGCYSGEYLEEAK